MKKMSFLLITTLITECLIINGCQSPPTKPLQKQSIKQLESDIYKVAFINQQRLIDESKTGKAAQEEIKKFRKQKEELLSKKLSEVNNLKKLRDEGRNKLDPRDNRAKVEAHQRAYDEYQKLVERTKEEIKNKDRELVMPILKYFDEALRNVAQKLNYTIILKDPTAIGYLDPRVDITNFVLKECE